MWFANLIRTHSSLFRNYRKVYLTHYINTLHKHISVV